MSPRRPWYAVPVDEALVLDQVEEHFTVGTSLQKLLNPDPARVGVLLQSTGSGSVTVTTSPKSAYGQGLIALASFNPIIIRDEDFPGFAARGLYGIASAAGTGLTVIYVRLVAG